MSGDRLATGASVPVDSHSISAVRTARNVVDYTKENRRGGRIGCGEKLCSFVGRARRTERARKLACFYLMAQIPDYGL
jgi:hypothetical protein